MLLALAAMAALPGLVPARWMSNDPATLDLVRMTPVNCVLIEPAQWSKSFNDEASKRAVAVFAVVHPQADAASISRVVELGFDGIVLEGDFEASRRDELAALAAAKKIPVIELGLRSRMNFDGSTPVVGTFQGLWPGIQVEADGKMKAAPSGAAWIDTNTGFLRFAAASTKSTIWIGNQPPKGLMFPAERYMQAVADAAMTGARWVVALDDSFTRKLLARDPKTVDGWKRIGKVLEYFEAHPQWRGADPFAGLALVEDAASGALLSGGILDMIATKHTPVRPVPGRLLNAGSLGAARMAVNVDPESLTPEQKEALKSFTRAGGTLLTGPPGWKFPNLKQDQITLEKDDLKKLDDIWRELNSLTGRKNLGARLFNVSSMLSNVSEISSRGEVLVHLVNYSDYPVENVTVHVLGTYKSAILERPDGPPIPLSGYEIEDGTGYDVERISSVAALILKK
jgi:hypothetical protein